MSEVTKTGYKNTKLGWIPEDWKVTSLGKIGTFSKGKNISKADIKEAGLPCVIYGDLYTIHHEHIRKTINIMAYRFPDLFLPNGKITQLKLTSQCISPFQGLRLGGIHHRATPDDEVMHPFGACLIATLSSCEPSPERAAYLNTGCSPVKYPATGYSHSPERASYPNTGYRPVTYPTTGYRPATYPTTGCSPMPYPKSINQTNTPWDNHS